MEHNLKKSTTKKNREQQFNSGQEVFEYMEKLFLEAKNQHLRFTIIGTKTAAKRTRRSLRELKNAISLFRVFSLKEEKDF